MNRRQRRANTKRGRTSNSPTAESVAGRVSPASARLLQVGVSHHQGGRLAEAEACYRQILAAHPDHAATHCNLGAILHKQGKLDEAIAAYRQAIHFGPHHALPHANLGSALKSQHKAEDAIAAFREAIRIDPKYIEGHFHLGIALRDQRMFDEAEAAFLQAIQIKPDHSEAYCNLGIALSEQGKLDEAIAAQRKAIRIKPDYAAPYYNLGRVLYLQSKPDEAITAYRNAITLKPDLADAHNGLGVALMDLGRLSEAREALEQAIRLAPDNAKYRRDAGIATHFAAEDPRLAEMEQLTADSASRSVIDRIELHFALGKAYDDVGRYADAFRQWLDGNALQRQRITYDETATLEELDQVRSVFTAELIHASQGAGHPLSLPVFIVGMPRSGSTLVEQILASHPGVFAAGELPYFRNIVEGMLTTPGSLATAGKDIRGLGERYHAAIEKLAPAATHVTDKMPRNFIFSGLIHLALPNAPIIHTIRNPIDTCLSCFSMVFTGEQDYTYDLAELGRYYRRYQSLMQHWHRVLPPGRILDVHYEDVVADLEGQARRIIDHCGLDWDPRCLVFHKTDRPVHTASVTQVRQPLYNSAVGRWRRYADFLAPLLTELNYSGAGSRDREAAKSVSPPDGPTGPSSTTHQ